jgi:hypothetical protein
MKPYDASVQLMKRTGTVAATAVTPTGSGLDINFGKLSPSAIKDAWDKTGENVLDTEGNEIEGLTIGQAATTNYKKLIGDNAEGLSFDNTPEAAQARNEYYKNTWEGRLASGSIDFVATLGLDPLIVGGKAVTAVRKTENILKAENVGSVFSAARGETEAAGLVGRQTNRLQDLVRATDDMSESEIATLPQLANSGDGGTLAYLLGRVNKDFKGEAAEEVEARTRAKLDVLGAAAGDKASLASLREKQGVLAEELERLRQKPVPLQAAEKFKWEDGGQGSWEFFNQTDDVFVANRIDEIESELDRLGRVADPASRTVLFDQVGSLYREQAACWNQSSKTRSSTTSKSPTSDKQLTSLPSTAGSPLAHTSFSSSAPTAQATGTSGTAHAGL